MIEYTKAYEVRRSDRDTLFDVLRVVSLLCIFLAHVSPPEVVFQLRHFGVPLLVIVSGSVFRLYSSHKISFWNYFRERFARLLGPTYAFLNYGAT